MKDLKDLTPEEMIELEEAAIRSAMNIGRPEKMGCGVCGFWYSYDDYMQHPCVTENTFTPEEEKQIDDFMEEHKKLFDDLVKAGD